MGHNTPASQGLHKQLPNQTQCLQLKIWPKNVQNQTRIGPNFSEKSRPKSDLMGPLSGPVQHKSDQNLDFCHEHTLTPTQTNTFRS